MNISKIQERLDSLNNKGRDREKIDYEKIFWKPQMGKQVIRIVPSKVNSDYPFTEMKFHYKIGKFPMPALSNFGKQDPVEEFCQTLKDTGEKENWSLAGKIGPKTRVFAPVVVRGEEDKGVRLWGFGIQVYKALLSYAEDPDIGDYTDIKSGFDIVVQMSEGNPYPETNVHVKPKQSPLSKDKKELENWLEEQPEPLEVFTQYDYEYIKKQLKNYLDPNDDEESDETSNEPSTSGLPFDTDDDDDGNTTQAYKMKVDSNSKLKQFDDLFND